MKNYRLMHLSAFVPILIFACTGLANDPSWTQPDAGGDVWDGDSSTVQQSDTNTEVGGSTFNLTHLFTTEMEVGTHRPEILTTDDGELVVVVVHPSSNHNEAGSTKHRAYRFTADLTQIGEAFPVAYNTDEYGSPADHRAMLLNDELVIVYQTLIAGEGSQNGGPAEANADSQSLLLARYDLEGNEILREPIIENETDFDINNFPDHCLLWRDEHLLVSTGAGTQEVNFYELDLEANILDSQTWSVSFEGIPSPIGNSLFENDDQVMMLSALMGTSEDLVLVALADDYEPTQQTRYSSDEVSGTFPTGTHWYQDYLIVGYSGRAPGGSFNLMENPYSPYVTVLDSSFNPVLGFQVSDEPGSGHVHTTVTTIDDRLYVAWSRQAEIDGRNSPQVVIDVYQIGSD